MTGSLSYPMTEILLDEPAVLMDEPAPYLMTGPGLTDDKTEAEGSVFLTKAEASFSLGNGMPALPDRKLADRTTGRNS